MKKAVASIGCVRPRCTIWMRQAGRRSAFMPPEMMGVVSATPSHSCW